MITSRPCTSDKYSFSFIWAWSMHILEASFLLMRPPLSFLSIFCIFLILSSLLYYYYFVQFKPVYAISSWICLLSTPVPSCQVDLLYKYARSVSSFGLDLCIFLEPLFLVQFLLSIRLEIVYSSIRLDLYCMFLNLPY